jgi:hypothetical protein
MNDITQLSTLYSNAIARAEKAEEALRTGSVPVSRALEIILSSCRVHDRLSGELKVMLGSARSLEAALAPPPVRETP